MSEVIIMTDLNNHFEAAFESTESAEKFLKEQHKEQRPIKVKVQMEEPTDDNPWAHYHASWTFEEQDINGENLYYFNEGFLTRQKVL